MLFFVHAELAEQPSMPREQYLGMIASTWQTIKQLENSGKVVGGGAIVGRRAGVVIVDVDSHEELGLATRGGKPRKRTRQPVL